MGIDDEVTRTAGAEGEPGTSDFNVRNYPRIQKLFEDRKAGLSVKIDPPTRDKIIKRLKKYGFYDVVENYITYEDSLFHGVILPEFGRIMSFVLSTAGKSTYDDIKAIFPRIVLIADAYLELVGVMVAEDFGKIDLSADPDNPLRKFSEFQFIDNTKTTNGQIDQWFKEREYAEPESVDPWEMRIGGSRFFVPPISVNVSQQFKTGSLSGGALRQQNSPKFNAGHSETMVDITLYFPNHETIWGYDDIGAIKINFDKDGDTDQVIDKFMSSLRGLITQFKYAPFLPVRNEYLNRTYDITAVALHSMTVQTVEGFPFCLAVNLSMCKFNHKAYLPPVSDFNQAIHWGRFRQYVGRAAQKMNSMAYEGFLTETFSDEEAQKKNTDDGSGDNRDENQTRTSVIKYEREPTLEFNKVLDFEDGKHFQLYFPERTTAKVFLPDTKDFRQNGEDTMSDIERSAWNRFIGGLGYLEDRNPEDLYEIAYNSKSTNFPPGDIQTIKAYLQTEHVIADTMFSSKYRDWLQKTVSESKRTDKANYENELQNAWFSVMWEGWKLTPFFQDYIENARLIDGNFTINEWQVPMHALEMDWTNAIVKGVTVSMGNNLVRHQLQLQQEPVYQHIGGLDSTVNVQLTIFGEDNLIKFRRVFEHVNGLARLEHAHGTLGFLGIKNVVTALAGIKYVLPLDYQVETVQGFPHVYDVSMSFVDFDIFQQKRESLSSAQQKQLVEAFGKRNPFFRIKQLWGAFNAYPDFPLAVRDDNGNIVGNLNPDFYFRAYQMFDDDIFHWGEDKIGVNGLPSGAPNTAGQTEDEARGGAGSASNRKIEQIKEQLKRTDLSPTQRAQLMGEMLILAGAPTAEEGDPNSQVQFNENATLSDYLGGTTHAVNWSIGLFSEAQDKVTNCRITSSGLEFGETNTTTSTAQTAWNGSVVSCRDNLAEQTLNVASTLGATAYSAHMNAHVNGEWDPMHTYELMMTDASYRDISGRMIRAFPTYMLWLIDEGGRFAGVKLFDNFYGLQSIIDFSVVGSEDILGDTLVLRLSNLYSKLSTPYSGYLNPDSDADIIDSSNNSNWNLPDYMRNVHVNGLSGTKDNYLVTLDTIRLKPGIRVHLRAGYSSNPNHLHTLFNGTITEVRAGDIVEVVAQSDAIELSPYINTSNKKGSSGKLDGALSTGLWLSEPRDLMVRLLSMGSSGFKEQLAHATNGMIFSENKFGIRHFGQILYEPMTDGEKTRHDAQGETIAAAFKSVLNPDTSSSSLSGVGYETGQEVLDVVNPVGAIGDFFDVALGSGASTRSPMVAIIQTMWQNAFRRRDYEIFKRNIYPGNGMGVAQFLGGDTLDGGVALSLGYDKDPEGPLYTANGDTQRRTPGFDNPLNPTVKAVTPTSELQGVLNEATGGVNAAPEATTPEKPASDQSDNSIDTKDNAIGGVVGELLGVFTGKTNNPLTQALGLTQAGPKDDDLKGFDEVSFRAQTYMKSVWDLFQLCAALLPNYIVAVRPFEDRSTVFYGKPHWQYTSGLIPITAGVGRKDGPLIEGPDLALQKAITEVLNAANSFSDIEEQNEFFATSAQSGNPDPAASGAGIKYSQSDLTTGPLVHPVTGGEIPVRTGKVAKERHMRPHTGTHVEVPGLPAVDNYTGAQKPEGEGAFGLTPEQEKWYMCAPWKYQEYPFKGSPRNIFYDPKQSFGMVKNKKVLVYAPSTGLSVVCAVGDYGPGPRIVGQQTSTGVTGRIGGLSPDTMYKLGIKTDDQVYFSWANDNDPLGPLGALAPNSAVTSTARGQEEANKAGTDVENDDPNKALTIEQIRKLDSIKFGDQKKKDSFIDLVVLDAGEMRDDSIRPSVYAYNSGYLKGAGEDVPVWIAPSSNDTAASGKFDVAGILARRLYDKDYAEAFEKAANANAEGVIPDKLQYSPDEFFERHSGEGGAKGRDIRTANSVWNGFRDGGKDDQGWREFAETKVTLALWNSGLLPNENGQGLNPGPLEKMPKAKDEIGIGDDQDQVDSGLAERIRVALNTKDVSSAGRTDADVFVLDKDNRVLKIQYNKDKGRYDDKATARFAEFLWKDPYARAWLVITTNRSKDNTGVPGFDLDNPISNDNNWDFNRSPVQQLFQYFLVVGANVQDKEHMFDWFSDFSNKAGEHTPRGKVIAWMRAHREQGRDVDDPISIAKAEITDIIDKTIGKLWKYISISLSSVLGLYRASMAQLGQNLENVSSMQKQANVLNHLFNDSVYYAEGEPYSVTRAVDNPFTREYGEPVVEIREPFQRMHYIDSFQHIISNNITENLNNVCTVVTATSDGNYPVTVYFDKGSPPERQVEKAVETGLFWDNAQGSGFFGFLHPLLHPIEKIRGVIKEATGSSDELLSKRVALYNLKESLKDIYTGEVVVLGNPDIRAHDLVYIADVYERMYGLFEVEQVVHHFTPDMGFITSITPNAVVTINDPSRWSMISWIWSWFSVKNMRDDVKSMMQERGRDSSELSRLGVTVEELARTLTPQLNGHLQYAHGNSALIKDITAAAALGNMPMLTSTEMVASGGTGRDINGKVIYDDIRLTINPVHQWINQILKGPFDWVRDNLVDQHGCYIQYLNKNGQPMDAGLSYNQGIAVGQHHSISLLPGILGLNLDVYKDGHRRITTNDLLKSLGWNEIDVTNIERDLSFWVNQTNAQVLGLAGKSPDQVPFEGTPDVHIVTVAGGDAYFDGDTFTDTEGKRWRLAGVGAAETPKISIDLETAKRNLASRAAAFLFKRLITDAFEGGFEPTVAVRVGINAETFDRTAAVIFHNVPEGTGGAYGQRGLLPDDVLSFNPKYAAAGVTTYRDKALFDLASQYPIVAWDSYMQDGRPYTINWEIIAAGLAETYLFRNTFETDKGVMGIGRG